MDPSNEILLNSPALHSLKRAQLLLLCKRYNIKQSGKNEDLVVRLRQYAQGLVDQSQSQPGDVSAPANADGQPEFHLRTSQQWELVEGDSREEENSTVADKRNRTLSIKSIGAMSTKSGTSVSSSLMSIANSLKRAGSKSSKFSSNRSTNSTSTTSSIVKQPLSHLFPSVPASAQQTVTVPTDTTSTESKVDISVVESEAATEADNTSDDLARPIVDGQVDGSKLQKEQATVRLVTPVAVRLRSNASHPTNSFPTPVLKPFHLPLPPSEPLPVHPNEEIGLAFLNMDARSFTETMKSGTNSADVSVDEVTLNPTISIDECKTPTPSSPSTINKTIDGLKAPSPGPFIFGSPANAVSNAEFGNAAAAILEEMNKRLGIDNDSTRAARVGADGRFEFGEVTPSRGGTLIGTSKREEGRFGRMHEKEFDKMESIADYHNNRLGRSPVKPSTSLAGTKRKSTYSSDEPAKKIVGKHVICLDDPKDKTAAVPAPKRQKVDGADLAKMEKANVTARVEKTIISDATAVKKLIGTKERRRSSTGRRSSAANSNARRKSVAQAKAAPSSRLGLLRGAAKVMKSIISTVSHPTPAPSNNAKAPTTTAPMPPPKTAPTTAATAAKPEPSGRSTPATGKPTIEKASARTSTLAPKPTKPSLPGGPSRPSSVVPRASSTTTTSRNASASTSRTGASSLAPKAPVVAQRVRGSVTSSARGKIPVFPDSASANGEINMAAIPGTRASSRLSAATSAPSRRTSNMSTSTTATTSIAKKPAAARSASGSTMKTSTTMSSLKSSAAASSVKSKMSVDSVPEKNSTKGKDTDFEPAMPADEEHGLLRPDSPIPAPPASLSSRPLTKRAPLEPTQPTATTTAASGSGSMGRKPRISRSKVIAKVHASREVQTPKTPLGSTKARKSVGASVSAKAKMMGGGGGEKNGLKARASIVAEAAKRKARISEAASARRRTLALQAKA